MSSNQTSEHISLTKLYSKISGVFADSESLMTKLKEDCRSSSKNFLLSSIFSPEKSIHDLDKESSTFIWFPLLIETVIRMPQSKKAKEDLLNECQLEYIDNDFEQKIIEQFRENYQTNDALSWYIRDCFLYRFIK